MKEPKLSVLGQIHSVTRFVMCFLVHKTPIEELDGIVDSMRRAWPTYANRGTLLFLHPHMALNEE